VIQTSVYTLKGQAEARARRRPGLTIGVGKDTVVGKVRRARMAMLVTLWRGG